MNGTLMQQNLSLLQVNMLTNANYCVISELLKGPYIFAGGLIEEKLQKSFTSNSVRTESGSIAKVSHLTYFYKSAKYNIGNKNDTIF